jgi:hypothetical protein
MSTKNLIPRADGEGGIGIPSQAWGSGYFKSGAFETALTVSGVPVSTGSSQELNDLSSNVTWANVPDANITESSVTQHESALSITSSQVSDLTSQGFLTQESNDLSSNVTWANVPDANITESSVTQHSGALSIGSDQIDFNSSLIPDTNAAYDLGSAEKKIRHLYLSDNSLNIGDVSISIDAQGDVSIPAGIKVGAASIKPDPNNPEVVSFNKVPKVSDSEGNPVTILTADKLGLGTSAVLSGTSQDIQFKLLTDENRFVVGTTGEGGLASGWYRFNDFNVKGATDVGAHTLNPVDTRIYSDSDSFVYMTRDAYGNRVAHLVGGDEKVSPANNIALGLAIKIDSSDTPEDIEFTHTDGEQYSLVNGDSDSKGINGLPVRQGFQAASIGAYAQPLLIDGGYF